MKYDNPHWEFHLPINPPISEEDIDPFTKETYSYVWYMDRCDLANWNTGTAGSPYFEYRPRLREHE